jgi:hypothetical protein
MSDHLSSPRVEAEPASDICDLYAFPSPERPGQLTLAMTVLPRAGPTARFSDAVLCRFRLRPASIAATGTQARFTVADEDAELRFDVMFSEPSTSLASDGLAQKGTCTTPSGAAVPVTVNDRHGSAGEGLRLFAGLVSDPFIFQIESIVETLMTGQMAFGKHTSNTMEGANTLGLVVELDCVRWLGGEGLVAVVGETLAVGKRPVRLERVGRPEIKNIGLQWNGNDTVNRDIDLRELYNQEDAFQLSEQYLGAYRARLGANLRFYDGLDGKVDWPPDGDGEHPLVELLLQDYLVVDPSKPFAEDSWFEIEQAMLAGRPHQSCGGRAINDDFLDTYYSVFINAGNGPRISDGVDQATVPATNDFPYLAPPNPSPAEVVKEDMAAVEDL